MDKIALLFLTMGNLNHSHFWKTILDPVKDHFSIYIHSKEGIEDPYFKQYQIPTVQTNYLIHAKAWQVLLQEALQNPENKKFIFLSESCIPLYPLELIYEHLIHSDKSQMMYGSPWWDEHEPREVIELPKEHRWGNAEWMILNRRHAQIVAEDKEIIQIAEGHIHDQESYPSILFSVKGCLDEFVYRQVTFAVKDPDHFPHPVHFDQYDNRCKSHIRDAKLTKCLFARKFDATFPEECLFSIINTPMTTYEGANKALLRMQEMDLSNKSTMLCLLIAQLGLKVGCEIGSFCGLHMKDILEKTGIEKLYGVDTYENNSIFSIAEKVLAPFSDKAEIVKKDPLDYAKKVSDHSLDFVFINSNHDKTDLISILEAWHNKVRPKGLISGYYLDELPIAQKILNYYASKQLPVYHFNRLETGFWVVII